MNLIKKLMVLLLAFMQANLLTAQEANNVFSWAKFPRQVDVLDSLIVNSALYGLKKTDYGTPIIKNIVDSSIYNQAIQKKAIHFFTDLAYGNKLPSIGYYGVQFKLDKDTVIHQVNKYAQKGRLIELANYYNTQSKEVVILLAELRKLQDSVPKPNKAIQFIIKSINDYRWLHAIQKN